MAECKLGLTLEFNEEEEMIINQEYKIWKK
jgi:hypothetical protein